MAEQSSRNVKITITVAGGKVITIVDNREDAEVFLEHVQKEGLVDEDANRHYPPDVLTISVAPIDDPLESPLSEN